MTGRARRAITDLGAPFRLVFRRAGAQPEIDPDPPTPHVPEVEFVGYADDCILSGHLRLNAERLSDLLNEHEQFELIDVLVAPLSGAPAFELRDLLLARDELMLVHATGPRGNSGRRQRTRQHSIVAKSGPYEVKGYVHVVPGSDPITSFRRRKPMVALTNAVIRYQTGSASHERRVGTVIVNRELIDWIAEGEDEEVLTVDMPAEPAGPLAKDFTGDLVGS